MNLLVLLEQFLSEKGMETQTSYNQMASSKFKSNDTFMAKVPMVVDNKKITIEIPLTLDMSNLEKEVEQYLQAPPDMKQKFDTYAFWYDNFNKLIFSNLEESDACLFLAACAYCSANTALDQNILEAAKLFDAVKHDFMMPNGKQALELLANNVDNTMDNEQLKYLENFGNRGSKYAAVLTPKLDYKGGNVQSGARKGQDDIFSEITLPNAKIPNFNRFVKYYLKKNGNVTKEQIIRDFVSGALDISGTKVGSFFMNLIFPGYKWNEKIQPATIDRWMIRVFFDKPVERMVKEDVAEWIKEQTDSTNIKPGKKDTPEVMAQKREAILKKQEQNITKSAIMSLFATEEVRQNLIVILNKVSKKMGLTPYQLQALAWVNIRKRYDEPAAKFTKFEDVMDYAEEAAQSIMSLNPNENKILNTIKILAAGPRFKFTDKQKVIDTIENREKYKKVYYLPPKNDAEEKMQKKASMNDNTWVKIRVAMKTDQSADIFDLGVSKKVPVQSLQGTDRPTLLRQVRNWIVKYNPVSVNKAA